MRGPLRPLLPIVLLALALLAPARAGAGGGDYVFSGGTPAERAQVRQALDASSFDWDIVRARITIHVASGVYSSSAPGHIWIDSDLLAAGRFAWAIVQHEYAHQVDFFLLDPERRARLGVLLGGGSWAETAPGLAHADYGCERFASTLVWAYWPSPDNALKPAAKGDESAAMAPARFRALLTGLLGAPDPFAPRLLAVR